MFRTLGTFSGSETQLRSWVFTIAHRRLVDEQRRAARQPWSGARVAEHDDGPAAPSAEHQALERLDAERVRIVCRGLAPDQRDVLLLRLVAGLSVEEVAAAVDKSSGAVKALQRRGIVALRKIFLTQGVPL